MIGIGIGISPCFSNISRRSTSPRDPSQFGGILGAWYADTGVTLNGANVAAWAPAYGSSGALSQATAAAQPLANVLMPNGNLALGFAADALSTTLPTELTSGYFAVVMAVSDRNGGRVWGGRNSTGSYALASHNTTTQSKMFTGPGVGPNSTSTSSSAIIGFSANIGGTNQKAWGSGSGLVSYSGAFALSGSSIATFVLGAHDASGAAGATCNYGALWLFAGDEIDLEGACLQMAQLYPEVAP